MFLKVFTKLTEIYICRRLLSDEVEGCRLKRDSGAGAFLYFAKLVVLVVHVRTATSDILGYSYIEIYSAKSTFKKCTVFSSILVFIHFKLILESCTTSVVYLQPYQTDMMKLLAVCIFEETPHYRYLARF